MNFFPLFFKFNSQALLYADNERERKRGIRIKLDKESRDEKRRITMQLTVKPVLSSYARGMVG